MPLAGAGEDCDILDFLRDAGFGLLVRQQLAAEALRVLKKSIQHAGARKTRLGRRPLIPVAPGSALAWWEKGVEHKTETGAGPSVSGCLAPPHQSLRIAPCGIMFLGGTCRPLK